MQEREELLVLWGAISALKTAPHDTSVLRTMSEGKSHPTENTGGKTLRNEGFLEEHVPSFNSTDSGAPSPEHERRSNAFTARRLFQHHLEEHIQAFHRARAGL